MNESRTCVSGGPNLTQRGSRPVRWRLTHEDGRRLAPFRLKPGVRITEIMPKGDGWELEAA